MAYVPDSADEDMKDELVTEKGQVSYVAYRLFVHFCKRRNKDTGVCFPSQLRISRDTGIAKTNVSQLIDFLEEKFWILREENKKIIRPLKGFYDLEFAKDENGNFLKDEKGQKILISRTDFHGVKVLINRTEILKIRTQSSNDLNTPLKDVLNQPNEPVNGTSGATRVAAPGAKKLRKPAEKPAPRSSASKKPTNAAPAGKPADNRIKHPAIQMVKAITGRYPTKDIWDRIIREINAKDVLFFKNSFEIWRSFKGSPQSFDDWLFIPNETKLPPQRFPWKDGNSNGNGHPNKPFEPGKDAGDLPELIYETESLPLNVKGREAALKILRGMLRETSLDNLQAMSEFYTVSDWKWLMEELEK
ncbi:MAG: helix-turn-helix domain-containing protein [Pyrinomonadaceae bacterium]|nr:helix-turn-helix domain-containing protein [Pyrinomonadaceae bacterium]